MRYKLIGILSIVLLVALTLASVSAADDNSTDEIIAMENTQENDTVILEQSNTQQAVENDSNESADSDAQSNDVLGMSSEKEVVLTSASEAPVLGATITAPAKLSVALNEPEKLSSAKKTVYKKFKGKSKYSWKIKMSTWVKMKKQAKKWYKRLRSVGSSTPGCSNSIKVIVKIGRHKYTGIAFAVKNYRGIRCEVRRLPHGVRASNWGDY